MAYKPGKAAITAAAFSFAITAVPVGPAYAALIPTENIIAAGQMSAERERVASFMAREDVRKQLGEYGVNPDEAAARVAALSDGEINAIATRIEELPAGQNTLVYIASVALTIFIILLITDLLCLTTVFNFTRCAR